MKSSDVVNVKTFVEFCHQQIGVTGSEKDFPTVRKQSDAFFARFAEADWATLCRGVNWFRDNGPRPYRMSQVIPMLIYPIRDGVLPEVARGGARWVKW